MLMNDLTYRMFNPHLENPTRDDFAAASQSGMALPTPWVDVDDVSSAVVFLASEESRLVTGVAFPVDAGAAMK